MKSALSNFVLASSFAAATLTSCKPAGPAPTYNVKCHAPGLNGALGDVIADEPRATGANFYDDFTIIIKDESNTRSTTVVGAPALCICKQNP